MAEYKRPSFLKGKYLINKRFQLKYTGGVVFLCSIIFSILGYYFYQTALENTDLLQIQNFELKGMIQAEDNWVLFYLITFFVLQVGSLFVLGTLLTHRIVGPTFAIGRVLSDVSEGKYKRMRPLRKSDEFHEFVDRINDMVDHLRDGVQSDMDKIASVENFLQEHRASFSDAKTYESLSTTLSEWKNEKEKFIKEDKPFQKPQEAPQPKAEEQK